MQIYDIIELHTIPFALVLLRVLSFFISMPVLSLSNIPVPVKVLFALSFSIMMFPVIEVRPIDPSTAEMSIMFLAAKEMLIGLMLGFIARILFFVVSICGQMVALSIGLANAQIFNPQAGAQTSSIESFQTTLAILFFLSINGHHMFIKTFVKSFREVPVNGDPLIFSGFETLVAKSGVFIEIGMKLSFPVVAAILLMNVAMGVVGRTVPQINILITSIPVNILVGLGVLLLTLPIFFTEFNSVIEYVALEMMRFMRSI